MNLLASQKPEHQRNERSIIYGDVAYPGFYCLRLETLLPKHNKLSRCRSLIIQAPITKYIDNV